MKLVLTGAGGGHFYPLIAVAERVEREAKNQKVISVETFFLSDKEYDKTLLESKKIKFVKIPAGKLRLYFSIQNFFDPFKSVLGFFVALWKLFVIYPDVVFVKGGYSSMPVALAARCLFIPIFVHESDSAPGRTTLLVGKLAKRIAVSYASAVKYFNLKKTAYTGQPILEEYLPTKEELDRKFANYSDDKKKTILVLGGSQGSEIINNMLLECLPELLKKYDVIHQVGPNNINSIKIASEILLKNNPHRENYKFFSFGDLSRHYEAADLCITRAGSSLFELSAWGIPSIVIPITVSNNNHQMTNAFTFEKAGCSIVIEEINLKRNLFINEINSVLEDTKRHELMQFNNLNSFKSGAAEVIAKEIVKIGLSHI